MADIYTSREDEKTIEDVLFKGLQVKAPKWTVLRLALAHSLRIPSPPDETLDRVLEKGGEYDLEQVTGRGQGAGRVRTGGQQHDFTDAIRGMLGLYEDLDLFADDKAFRTHLQRHIRRGLREFRRGWRDGHDFHQFLYQELCAGQERGKETEETDFATRLISALAEIGVQGEVEATLDGPRITRYEIKLDDPNHLNLVNQKIETISFTLGLQKHGIFPADTGKPKVIALDIPRPRGTWKTFSGQDLLKWVKEKNKNRTENLLPLWPGVDVTGEPVVFDLARQPHLMVGGTTGSGKSSCLHTLILSLLAGVKRERLKLVLIDPKQMEFSPYAKMGGTKRISVITEVGAAQEQLAALVEEMESRTTSLKQVGVRDLGEGHRKGLLELPYIVVFVEELSDLVMQAPAAEESLIRLAQKARATGIHLVVATQRPDARTFHGLLRSNIPSRISLTVQKSSESKIILDETGAERLTGAGDMLIRPMGEPVRRVHGVYVTDDDIAVVMRNEGK